MPASPIGGTSRAVRYARYGGPEVIEVVERPDPQPGPGEVRLAVRAASVNPFDWKLRDGLLGSGGGPAEPVVPGTDVAGVVEVAGPGVAWPAVGEEVLGRARDGAYAEKALALAAELVVKPRSMSWEVAGSLEVVVNTAHSVLEVLDLDPGAVLLVHGASGAIGRIAAQTALARGVRVIGSSSPARRGEVAALGASPVTYGDTLADQVRSVAGGLPPRPSSVDDPPTVDAVLDAAGRGALTDLISLAGGPGQVVTIAHPDAHEHGVRFAGRRWVPDALAEAVARIAEGSLRPAPTVTYPLDRAAAAMEDNRTGTVAGKLVLTMEA